MSNMVKLIDDYDVVVGIAIFKDFRDIAIAENEVYMADWGEDGNERFDIYTGERLEIISRYADIYIVSRPFEKDPLIYADDNEEFRTSETAQQIKQDYGYVLELREMETIDV